MIGVRAKKRLTKLVIGCTMGLAVVAVAPSANATTTPGIPATPSNEGGEWWSTDGCTLVPDSGAHFDFHHACHHHDGCYHYHWSDRSTCDDWFLNDMFASCAELGHYPQCYARAELYYLGVRKFGQMSWDSYSVQIAMNQYV